MEQLIVEKKKPKEKKLLDELKFYENLIHASYKKEMKTYKADKGKIKCLRSTSCVINKVEVK